MKTPFSPDKRAPNEYLFHYTSVSTFLEYILPNKTLRLSPMSEVNDPKESSFSANFYGNSDIETVKELLDRLRMFHGSRVKAACFARDDPSIAFDGATHIFHGWVKPAMWAHYGDRHAGVCIAFRRDALLSAFNSQFNACHGTYHGDVNYQLFRAVRDGYFETQHRLHQPDFSISDLQSSFDATAIAYLDRHCEEMYFRKHGDWSNEREYRILTVSKTEGFEYLDVSSSIVGICAGLETDHDTRIILGAACGNSGIEFTKLHRGVFR